MYSFFFRKNLFQTIHDQNFEEDNQECIHLFSERFNIKQQIEKNFEEDNRECINFFSERFSAKQYISKSLKNTIENVFHCFPKDSL